MALSNVLRLALLVQAYDRLSAPVRQMQATMDRLDGTAKRAKGIEQWAERHRKAGETLRGLGAGIGGTGLLMGAALGLTDVPKQSADAEEALVRIGNAANLNAQQLAQARARLTALSGPTNQVLGDLVQGLRVYTAAGMRFNDAMVALPAVGRAATATGAAIQDLAKATYASVSNLKLPVDQVSRALEIMAVAGDAGKFELPDMAQYYDQLTASAGMLGMRELPGVAALSTALQIANRGAGGDSEAANNLANFLKAITSPEVRRNFAKAGVDLQSEVRRGIAQGDVILHMGKLVQRMTRGDAFKLGELFTDSQAQNFLKPMMANLKDYEAIKQEALTRRGKIDADFANALATTNQQVKQLRVQMAAVAMPWTDRALGWINGMLQYINASPRLQGATAALTTGAIAGGGLLTGLGLIRSAAQPAVRGLGMVKGAWESAVLRTYYWHDGVKKAFTTARSGGALRAMGQGLLGVARGMLGAASSTIRFTLALLANPVTWWWVAAAALIYGAVLIYRNWDKIAAFFGNLWTQVREAFSGFLTWLRGIDWADAGLRIVKTIGSGILAGLAWPVAAIKTVAAKVREYLPFSPAKTGPLRDLHRVRLVETVAGAMRPAPMVRAMRAAAAGTAVAAAGAGLVGAGGAAAGGAAGAPTLVFTYAPVVHAGATNAPAMRALLDEHGREMERRVRAIVDGRARRSYRDG